MKDRKIAPFNRCITISTLLFISLCINGLAAHAQFRFTHKPSETSLKIGDSIPDRLFQLTHEALEIRGRHDRTIELATYRDKFIILDFWASWCGPCKYSLNKLDSIANVLDDDRFVVVPVTYQSKREAFSHFDYDWNFTTIVNDTILGRYFPHAGIPHMVWIYQQKVVAMPKWGYATAENIKELLNGSLPVVYNNAVEAAKPDKPFFIGDNAPGPILYEKDNRKLAGSIPGYRREINTDLNSTNKRPSFYIINVQLPQLLFSIFNDKIFPYLRFPGKDPIVWQVDNKFRARFLEGPDESVGVLEEDSVFMAWQEKGLMSYAVDFTDMKAAPFEKKHAQQDLRNYFKTEYNVDLTIEDSPVRYNFLQLNLVGDSTIVRQRFAVDGVEKKILNTEYQIEYQNFYKDQFFSSILNVANHMSDLTIKNEVVNATGIDFNFPMSFKISRKALATGNLHLLNKELKYYGLSLSAESKYLPVLYVRQE